MRVFFISTPYGVVILETSTRSKLVETESYSEAIGLCEDNNWIY